MSRLFENLYCPNLTSNVLNIWHDSRFNTHLIVKCIQCNLDDSNLMIQDSKCSSFQNTFEIPNRKKAHGFTLTNSRTQYFKQILVVFGL